MRQFNAARIQRFPLRSAYGLRSYAADHAGCDEHVKNGADTQRTDKANRHIPLRILCLLLCRRYGVETHIRKETGCRRDRKSVWKGKGVSVRLDLGGRRCIKQKFKIKTRLTN